MKFSHFTTHLQTVDKELFSKLDLFEWQSIFELVVEFGKLDEDEVSRIEEIAYDSGYEDGSRNGYDDGYENGYDRGYDSGLETGREILEDV